MIFLSLFELKKFVINVTIRSVEKLLACIREGRVNINHVPNFKVENLETKLPRSGVIIVVTSVVGNIYIPLAYQICCENIN
jgi:hypothetical protein